ncbi:MAG: NADH-quinone oxidoreductase subunit L [Anaerolineales bacterium]|nr:NADH-quinone oxidoreductase subunit L [Anaerolineales bacterium]
MTLSNLTTPEGIFGLAPLIVIFPLIGLLINIIFGSRFEEKVIGTVASLAAGLSFLTALLMMFALIGKPEGGVVPLVEWITIGGLNLNWAFQIDTLSVTMMLVVAGVGTLIHIYSIGYMHEDVRHNSDPGRYKRFFVYMNLFIAAMMILVSSDNYLMMFVGWEGVGLCSFLLIGFWYEKGVNGTANATAAKKAMVVNRIGDAGFLIALFIMFGAFGSLTFEEVFALGPQIAEATPWIILAITLFFLVAVTGKSAQLPLFVWLPDAMAGPTPVSALIHAATMVTAGVYLIARTGELYMLVPAAQTWVTFVGGITALMAAIIAAGQFDIKKVLAYSTISQLGFMVAAVGMGAFVAGMFHLVMHAFFKALLFLSAGSVIHGMHHGQHYVSHHGTSKMKHQDGPHLDVQDIRNMGGLRNRMPTTFWVFTIGGLALAGIFPFAGFWSKDEILAESLLLQPPVYWLLTIAAIFTAFYVGRQLLLVFFGSPRSQAAGHAEESPRVMTYPLIILAFFSVIGGALNLPGVYTFTNWLEHSIAHLHKGEFNLLVAIISTGLALLALGIAWIFYGPRYEELLKLPKAKRPDDPLRKSLGPVFVAMESKFWVDELYELLFVKPYMAVSNFVGEIIDWRFWHDWVHNVVIAGGFRVFTRIMAVRIDLGIIDGIANGLGSGAKSFSRLLSRTQTGFVRNYALMVFFGVVLILGYLVLRY